MIRVKFVSADGETTREIEGELGLSLLEVGQN
ncbi:MAG: hypothetical protein RLZZ366_2019, partial [Pseudomonadota bacterium]